MPQQYSWPDADVDRSAEMAAAGHACARLLNALQQLHSELQSVPSGALRLRRYLEKREAAVQALVRHAHFVVSQFAFVDGERIEQADKRLLEVFYADPIESVAVRYCWALLLAGEETSSLPGIMLATRAEYEAFTEMQASEEAAQQHRDTQLASLVEAEHGYRKRADRTAYVLAVLRRLLVIHRHVGGSASQSTRALESEVVRALEASEEVAATLREIRRVRISWRGGGSQSRDD